MKIYLYRLDIGGFYKFGLDIGSAVISLLYLVEIAILLLALRIVTVVGTRWREKWFFEKAVSDSVGMRDGR